jgi:hypothetical protein
MEWHIGSAGVTQRSSLYLPNNVATCLEFNQIIQRTLLYAKPKTSFVYQINQSSLQFPKLMAYTDSLHQLTEGRSEGYAKKGVTNESEL